MSELTTLRRQQFRVMCRLREQGLHDRTCSHIRDDFGRVEARIRVGYYAITVEIEIEYLINTKPRCIVKDDNYTVYLWDPAKKISYRDGSVRKWKGGIQVDLLDAGGCDLVPVAYMATKTEDSYRAYVMSIPTSKFDWLYYPAIARDLFGDIL